MLWVLYAIAACIVLFYLAWVKRSETSQKNLIMQADAIAGQIPAMLENSFYCESASRRMDTAKLDALVYALDDRKDIEEEKDLLDDFAAQARVEGLVVYDSSSGALLYGSAGTQDWSVDQTYLQDFADLDEEKLFEMMRNKTALLRKHYFSSDNLIQIEEDEADSDEETQEDQESQLQMQFVSRMTEHGKWIVTAGNVPSDTEMLATSAFDWRTVLSRIRVGGSGSLLAVDDTNGTVLLCGSRNVSDLTLDTLNIQIDGMDHSASLEELKDAFRQADQTVRIRMEDSPCLAVRVNVNNVLMLAIMPEDAAIDVLSGELYMRILCLLLMTVICMLYSWFHLSDTEEIFLRRRGNFTWNATLSGKLAACTILVAAFAFAASLFMEFLSVHADVYSSSRSKVSEMVDTYADNQMAADGLLRWFQEENLDRVRVSKVILDHADEGKITWDYLDGLSESLNLRYLYLYDAQGKIILTNSPYDRVVVNRENPFYALLEGRAEMALEPGTELLMTGVSVRDANHVCTGLIVGVADEVELEKIKENLGMKNAFRPLCLTDGSRVLIIDEENYIIKANAEITDGIYHNSVDGVDCTGYPVSVLQMDEAALIDSFNGRMSVNSNEYFASVVRAFKQFFVVLYPEQRISLESLVQPVIVTAAVLFFILLLTVISCLGREKDALPEETAGALFEENVPEYGGAAAKDPDAPSGAGEAANDPDAPVRAPDGKPELSGKTPVKAAADPEDRKKHRTKRSEEEVMAVFGSIMNRKKPYFDERWPNDVIRWKDKTSGDKFLFLLKMILTITFAAIFINTLFARENSLWYYVLDGEWNPGVNLHSITGCLIYISLLLFLKVVIHKVLFVIARAVDARGETICHLMDSASGYVLGIIGIFICLSKFGVDTKSLSLSAGVAGVIFGIACQSTVADILAGLIMSLEGIVHVGDFLMYEGKPANVLSIGVRATRLKFFSEITVVRNNEFKNFVLRPADKDDLVTTSIVIDQKESLEHVEAILEEELPKIHERMCAVSDDSITGPDYAGVNRVFENGVELAFTVICKGRYCLRLQRELNRQLKLLCERNHIAIAVQQIQVTENNV